MMIREGGTIMAYSVRICLLSGAYAAQRNIMQWDSMSRTWQKIGEVTGTDKPKAGEKVMFEGKQWDYVFDVAIEDGAPALKLPYNVSGMPPVLTIFVTLSLTPSRVNRKSVYRRSSLFGEERSSHAPPRRYCPLH